MSEKGAVETDQDPGREITEIVVEKDITMTIMSQDIIEVVDVR